MRSTFAGLNTMVNGIINNQMGLDTVGHNITNAGTTGYSRQSNDLAALNPSKVYSSYGAVYIGNGAATQAITRARDTYADRQYWNQNCTKEYYSYLETNLSKMEEIFNDTANNGVQSSMNAFYKAWVDLSANASTTSNRTAVIEQGRILTEKLVSVTGDIQTQIGNLYQDLELYADQANKIIDNIVAINKSILGAEASGAQANDLRDQRDLLVDELSGFMNITVYEDAATGMYTVVSNGSSLVNGPTGLHLQLGNRYENEQYGVTDYTLQLKETGTLFNGLNGKLQATLDSIETDKRYIDMLSNVAAFMMTTFNDQHRAGYGNDPGATPNVNFYGQDGETYTLVPTPDANGAYSVEVTSTSTKITGVKLIAAMTVNAKLTAAGGEAYIAARGLGIGGDITVNTGHGKYNLDPATGLYYLADPPPPPVVPFTGDYDITVTPDGRYEYDPATGEFTDEGLGNGIYSINGTGDGSNATLLSTLFNSTQNNTGFPAVLATVRSIGQISLNDYYNGIMTGLGIRAETVMENVDYQETMMGQLQNLREATSGVNWNEELTHMITYQQGYSACSRCLTTMDEMLDRLINSTGVVGR